MTSEPFHETGITIGTGVLATHVGVDDIVIDLRLGEDGLGEFFFNEHGSSMLSIKEKDKGGLVFVNRGFLDLYIKVRFGYRTTD
jgi:hypothetical protein